MSVSTILGAVVDGFRYATNPAESLEVVKKTLEPLFETSPETEGLTLASTFATAAGIGKNCLLVPIQGATSSAGNYLLIRHALKSFVEPEIGSAKDVAVHIISFVGSTIAGYQIAECVGYSDVPHLNPGYDPRFISLIASVSGAGLATLYCCLNEKKPEQEEEKGLAAWVIKRLV